MSRTFGLDTLEQRIEKAQTDVIKTKQKYDTAVATLKDLMDKRDAAKRDELISAIMKSNKTYDETGTKKIAALASYVIEGLEEGRILVVDELDSSIHFKLTRAIVAMFNNELNTGVQMIFTVHDINLMDCKRMFRKEQIWFVHKDEKGVYVYSLADFTAQQGVRDTTDVMEKYREGALGALPDPELMNSLLSIKGNVKGVIADGE